MKLTLVLSFAIVTLASLIDCKSSGKFNLRDSRAVNCDPEACALPECLCSNYKPPPPFTSTPEKIPQIVYLTFDGAINPINYPSYQDIFNDRVNPNGAKISGTFFINHEYNNYSQTHQLWRQGHEIALESITHKTQTTYWKLLDYQGWVDEIIDQRLQVSTFAKIPESDIIGFRAPFLQFNGDVTYRALKDNGIQYDSSRPTYRFRPGLWPYTADYQSIQDCQIEPCPIESHPGLWVSPIVDLIGENQEPCAFVDGCRDAPRNASETYDLLWNNFNEHYTGVRAPFGVYAHASWVQNIEAPWIYEGYLKFVDHILSLGDTYIVSIKKGLEWVKNPVGLDSINDFAPWKDADTPRDNCRTSFNCNYDRNHTPPEIPSERIMNSCILCPEKYPWINNPLGD